MTAVKRTASESDRREQLLAAARKVFQEKGYEGTTVSDIVDEAGVAQGTFYLYFPSKKDIILGLAEVIVDEIMVRVSALSEKRLSFEESIRVFVSGIFEVGRQNPDLCRLIHFGAESVAKDFHETTAQALLQNMTQMFQQAIDSGEMEPLNPELTARLLGRMLPSAIQEAFCFSDGSDAEELEAIVVQLLTSGLKRHP